MKILGLSERLGRNYLPCVFVSGVSSLFFFFFFNERVLVGRG